MQQLPPQTEALVLEEKLTQKVIELPPHTAQEDTQQLPVQAQALVPDDQLTQKVIELPPHPAPEDSTNPSTCSRRPPDRESY